MPTPDASQYTQFRRYASVAGDAVGSVGSKISPFNTAYSIPILTASSQALFLPSANKEKKFPPLAPSIPGPIWVRELGNGLNDVYVYGVATDPNDGTVLVCGETNQVLFGQYGVYNHPAAFIARYTSSGTFIAGGNIGNGQAFVNAQSITTDVHGNIYICGNTLQDLTNGSYPHTTTKGYFAKFSSSFELIWLHEEGGDDGHETSINVIMVSPDGYLYLGGNTHHYGNLVGFTAVYDATTGNQIYGADYGTGSGDVWISAITYIPVFSGGRGIPTIAVAGYSREDLNLDGGVSNPGGGGQYGFLSFSSFDLAPGPIYGLGSGNHNTVFTSMVLVTVPCGSALVLGGGTDEYLSGLDQDSLLVGGGGQGFLTAYFFGSGFSPVSLIGDERNFTMVTAISYDTLNICIGGITNENLVTNDTYTGMVLTNFTLQADFNAGLSTIQIGTGTSFEMLTGLASDTFGNFYAGGFTQEHLPSGPPIFGTNGYIANVATQQKTYNTPIFLSDDSSYNGGLVTITLEYTAPVTIDWGDGAIQTITAGSAGGFSHTYGVPNIYNIAVDVGAGGSMTLFRVYSGGIRTLDVSRCPTLLSLRCDNNIITNLDVSGCPNLTYIRCNGNLFVSLDVSRLENLTYLHFQGGNNAISTIRYDGCGLTDSTNTTLESSILELSNDNSYPGRIYLDHNQESLYFGGDAGAYFSGSLPDWTFIIIGAPGLSNLVVASITQHSADLMWNESGATSRSVVTYEYGTQTVVTGTVSSLTAGACTVTGVGNNSPGWGPYTAKVTLTNSYGSTSASITVSISCFLGSTKLQTRSGPVQASEVVLGTELLQPDGSYTKVVKAKESVVSKAVPAGDARLFADPEEKMIVTAWHKIRFADEKEEVKADVHPRLHEVFREMPFQVYHFELEDISHKILIADTDIIAESFSPNQAW